MIGFVVCLIMLRLAHAEMPLVLGHYLDRMDPPRARNGATYCAAYEGRERL